MIYRLLISVTLGQTNTLRRAPQWRFFFVWLSSKPNESNNFLPCRWHFWAGRGRDEETCKFSLCLPTSLILHAKLRFLIVRICGFQSVSRRVKVFAAELLRQPYFYRLNTKNIHVWYAHRNEGMRKKETKKRRKQWGEKWRPHSDNNLKTHNFEAKKYTLHLLL